MEAKQWLYQWSNDALLAIEQLTQGRRSPKPGHGEVTQKVIRVRSKAERLVRAYDPLDFAIPLRAQEELASLREETLLFLGATANHDCHQDSVDLWKSEIDRSMQNLGKKSGLDKSA